MPNRPRRPCRAPCCSKLAEPGSPYCKEHAGLKEPDKRSANERGYTYRWQQQSKAFLRAHPLCAECMRKDPPQYTQATVVDHIRPHRGNRALFWDQSNWQPLCKECHDLKTGREDSRPEYSY